MPISLPISATADDRAFQKIANRYEKWGADTGKKIGSEFSKGMGDALDDGSKSADKFEKAYIRVADTVGKVRVEEAKLQDLRSKGASDTRLIAQAEALEKARRAEARATKEAAAAYQEYEQASADAGRGGVGSFVDGLKGGIAGARTAGTSLADSFSGGFLGAGSLASLGSGLLRGGGWATAGVAAGKMFFDALGEGMQGLRVKDEFRAKLGASIGDMQRYGQAAGQAYANGWGESVEANLTTLQAGLQTGLIGRDASEADAQKMISQMQAVGTVMGEDPTAIARGARNFIKTGLVDDATGALDLLTAASQQGLNVSQDLLDTAEEYGTAWQSVGLSGQDALGLIKQMQDAGIRNTDVAADSVKELAISVSDGSMLTKSAFDALGLDAGQMAQRFAEGGPVAREALGEVLTGLKNLTDPMQRQQVGLALFKTKWEDAKTAISAADLPTAASELGKVAGASKDAADALGTHADGWDQLGRHMDVTFRKLKEWLADSDIGKFFNQGLPGAISSTLLADPQADAQALLDQAIQNAKSNTLGTGFADAGDAQRQHRGDPPRIGPVDRHDPIPMTTDSSGSSGLKPNIPLSQYSLDSIPLGQFAGESGIGLPGRRLESHSGPGSFQVDPQKIYDAQTQELSARQSLEEARRRVLEVEADNDHTAAELQDAKNRELLAERSYVKSLQEVLDAQQGTWENAEKAAQAFSDGMGDIGAALDNDLGISKGLPGIAENLVKFLGSLAFAPVVGALRGVQAANGFGPGQAGSGLAGIIGSATGMTGQRLQSGGTTIGANYPGSTSYPGSYPGDAALLANVPAGRYSQTGNADLTKGLGDCSSAVEDLVNIMDGRPTGSRQMSTGNAAEWLTSHGFQPGSMPGAFNVGYNAGHMQATLPGGTPFNWGSDSAAANRGVGGSGAFDPSFTSHYYRPVGQYPTTSTPAPSSSPVPGIGGDGGYAPLSQQDLTNPGLSTPTPAGGNRVAAFPGQGFPLPWTLGGPGGPGGIGGPDPTFPGDDGAGISSPTPGRIGPFPVPQSVAPGLGHTVGLGLGPGGGTPGWTTPSSVQGGRELGAGTPASGGINFSGGIIGAAGGAITSAIGAAGAAGTMGMDGGAGGAVASAAAQIGIQEGMRAIAYAGQLAGIGVSGLMETFSLNDSALADPGKSWLGRIAMGVAGARPALPNSAGASGGTENKNMAESGKPAEPPAPPGSVDPKQLPNGGAAGSEGQSGAGGNVDNSVTINHTSNNVANQQQAATLGDYIGAAQIARTGQG